MNGLRSNVSHLIQTTLIYVYLKWKALKIERDGRIDNIRLVAQKLFLALACSWFYPMYFFGRSIRPPMLDAITFSPASKEVAVEEYERICKEFPQPEYDELIFPNEPTRFKFLDPLEYYNANVVLDGTMIAAQGPTSVTKNSFWKMVWESGADNIVMVKDPVDQDEVYWPEERGRSERVGRLAALSIISERRRVRDGFEIRTRNFRFTNGVCERKVSQHHLCNWKERGVVSPRALADFTAMVEVKGTKRPLIVHCSEGSGRAGTFIATYAVYKRLLVGDRDPQLIEKTVRQLRDPKKGRDGMVQTAEQYCLIHEAVGELLDHIP